MNLLKILLLFAVVALATILALENDSKKHEEKITQTNKAKRFDYNETALNTTEILKANEIILNITEKPKVQNAESNTTNNFQKNKTEISLANKPKEDITDPVTTASLPDSPTEISIPHFDTSILNPQDKYNGYGPSIYDPNIYEFNSREPKNRRNKSRNRKSRQKNRKSGLNRFGRDRKVFNADNKIPKINIKNTKPIININFDSVYKREKNDDFKVNTDIKNPENANPKSKESVKQKRKSRSQARKPKLELPKFKTPNKINGNDQTFKFNQQKFKTDNKKGSAKNYSSTRRKRKPKNKSKVSVLASKDLKVFQQDTESFSKSYGDISNVTEAAPKEPEDFEHKTSDIGHKKIESKDNKLIGENKNVPTSQSILSPNTSKTEQEIKKIKPESTTSEAHDTSNSFGKDLRNILPPNIPHLPAIKDSKIPTKTYDRERQENTGIKSLSTNSTFNSKDNRKRENAKIESQTKSNTTESVKTEVESEKSRPDLKASSPKGNKIESLSVNNEKIKKPPQNLDFKTELRNKNLDLKNTKSEMTETHTDVKTSKSEFSNSDLESLLSDFGINTSESQHSDRLAATKPGLKNVLNKEQQETLPVLKEKVSKQEPYNKKRSTHIIPEISKSHTQAEKSGNEFTNSDLDSLLSDFGIISEPELKTVSLDKKATPDSKKEVKPNIIKQVFINKETRSVQANPEIKNKQLDHKNRYPDKSLLTKEPKSEIPKIKSEVLVIKNKKEPEVEKPAPRQITRYNKPPEAKPSKVDPKSRVVNIRASKYTPDNKGTTTNNKQNNPNISRTLPLPSKPEYKKPDLELPNTSPVSKIPNPKIRKLSSGNGQIGQKREQRQSRPELKQVKPKLVRLASTYKDTDSKSRKISPRLKTENKSKESESDYYERKKYDLKDKSPPNKPESGDMHRKRESRQNSREGQGSRIEYNNRSTTKRIITERKRVDPRYRTFEQEFKLNESRPKNVKQGYRKVPRSYENTRTDIRQPETKLRKNGLDHRTQESEYRTPRNEKYRPEINKYADNSLKAQRPTYKLKNEEPKERRYINDARQEQKTVFVRNSRDDRGTDEPEYKKPKINYKISETKNGNSNGNYKEPETKPSKAGFKIKLESENKRTTTEKFEIDVKTTIPDVTSESAVKEEYSTQKESFLYKTLKDWW